MSGVFVDVSLLLASEDGAHPERRAVALQWLTALWQRGLGRTSSQVLHDFYRIATYELQPPMPAGDARAEVRRYEHWQPWQIDHATVESAWAIESRFGLHFSDCLVVAAAQHLDCQYLLSEDLPHEQRYGAVQVINPFANPRAANLSLLENLA